jgi:large subunit ribosomal protein L6
MSRIGKKPIIIPKTVTVEQNGQSLKVSGPLGSLQMDCQKQMKVRVDSADGRIFVENEHPEVRRNKQLHGTTRALIANMIIGVSEGFARRMEIYGTGFSIKEQAGKVIFHVGFSHPVQRAIPKGIKVKIETGATRGDDVPAAFTLSGIDKCLVGQFAADIRSIRPPEPYKGKGIRYADEHVKRKVGKAFTSGTV